MNARKFVPQKHFVDRFPSFSTTEGCHRSIFLCMLETSKRRGGFQNESNNHRQLYCTEAADEESHVGTVSRKARCVEQDHLQVGDREVYAGLQHHSNALRRALPELMDGEDAADSSVRVYDDAQILDLLRRTQELERQKGILYGLVLIVLGIACGAMSKTTGGTDVQDFVSGVLMSVSVAEILTGIGIIGKRVIHK